MRLTKNEKEELLRQNENINNYFDHFCEFWMPIYKKQVNECKLEDNKKALSEIILNLVKNIHLTDDEKRYIAKRIGVHYLIEKFENKKTDDETKNELFKKHEKLIYLFLKRKGLIQEKDELYDIGLIGLVNGINTYDSKKGYKESTYFYKCISNQINQYFQLQSLPKRKCPGTILSLDKEYDDNQGTLKNLIPDSIDIEKEILSKEKNQILYKALDKLKPEWKYIIEKRYGLNNHEKQKQSEIAKHFGISKSAIYAKEKKTLKKLRKILLEEGMEVFEK